MGLSEQLVAHLNRVVPDDVALAALPGDRIRIIAGAEAHGWVEVLFWMSGAPDSFARDVLGNLQDEIIENVTHTGWPPVDPSKPDSPQRGSELPEPHAVIVDHTVHWWYGERENPALSLPPITLEAQ